MTDRTLRVTGMSCGGCESNVESELQALSGVDSVTADHETDTVELSLSSGVSDDVLTDAVQEAGYEFEG